MQVSVADAGDLRKQVTITYDASEVRQREDSMLSRYSSQAKVNGFRNGKAPMPGVADIKPKELEYLTVYVKSMRK